MHSFRHHSPTSVNVNPLRTLMAMLFVIVMPYAGSVTANENSFVSDNCDHTVAGNGAIQDAIDSALSGESICIESGTFEEELEITTSDLILRPADANAEPVLEGGSNGILIDRADNTVIEGLTIQGFDGDGIMVDSSFGAVIHKNNLTDNRIAINVFESGNLHILENEITDQQSVRNQGFGIEITSSDSTVIEKNVISDNPADAVHLLNSSHITLQDNEISDNSDSGVYVYQSANATLIGNTIADNNDYGIFLDEQSHEATLLDNTITGHDADIYMIESAFATINGNEMDNGLVIDPDNIRFDFNAGETYFSHSIENNTVNGGELFYGENISSEDVPGDAEQVIIHNSNDISLSDLSFSDVAIGLQVSYSHRISLTNITAENHVFEGVRLVVANNATVEESTFNENGTDGLMLESCENALVAHNSAAGNGDRGLVLFWSPESTFDNNTATDNSEEGIHHTNSNDGVVRNNTATGNRRGIRVGRSADMVIHSNTANENVAIGMSIGLVRRSEITDNTTMNNGNSGMETVNLERDALITGNESTNNGISGFRIGTSTNVDSDVIMKNNTLSHNSLHGAQFMISDGVEFSENVIEENGGHGINIGGNTENPRIKENLISDNEGNGIYIGNRHYWARIEANVVSGHEVDLWMEELTVGQIITENEFETGIFIEGDESENFRQNITNNTVNGKELYFSSREDTVEIPEDPGQVIVNSGGYVVIEDLDLEQVAAGIQVAFSDTLIIRNTNISHTKVALNLTGNEYAVIEENMFTNSETGVLLQGAYAPDIFEENEIHSNEDVGLDADNMDVIVDARNNWWGSESGPSGGEEDPETGAEAVGSGDVISGSVRFDPWLSQGTVPTYASDNGEEDLQEQPVAFELHQNYPNPFNPSTQIHYSLPEQARVRLDVYNVLGERVTTLVDEQQNPGHHEVTFDAGGFSSGVYLYRIQSGTFVESRQMLLIK